ncbi:MAG: hypothetical protein G01um101429_1155 [Parcubacteria group bacterium Gr01-1014_29]|nr:MAG: hypothetical protein G01um101429_1155 [Parcubacteria group bacterium Gr01-1014_29]
MRPRDDTKEDKKVEFAAVYHMQNKICDFVEDEKTRTSGRIS